MMNRNRYKWIFASLATGSFLMIGLLLLLGGASQIARAASTNLYVTPGGDGNCSQADPCTLQTAKNQAVNGDTIYLAQGVYTGTGAAVITLAKSLSLYGGWNGAPSGLPVRNAEAYPTVLDGEGARRVVYINSSITVILEGFKVTHGVTTEKGAGLYARNATLTLRAMTFTQNAIDVYDTPGTYAYGAGAYVEGGSLRVEASTFRANSAWAQKNTAGGGLAIVGTISATVENSLFQENDAWTASGLCFHGVENSHSPFTLSDSTFVDNGRGQSSGRASGGYSGAIEIGSAQAHLEGNTFITNMASNDYGAVSIYNSDLLFARNVLYDNQCGKISSLYLYKVSPFTVVNNIIAGNQSLYDWMNPPAVQVDNSDGQFLHNTISHNESAYSILVDSGANITLTNTILVGHTLGISVTAGSSAALDGTLWGSGSWANGADWGGDGDISTGVVNLWGNPAFVNPDGGDYHIGPGSAAINAGVNAGVTTDIDGDLRPFGAGYDIGADESRPRHLFLPLVVKKQIA